MVATPIEHGIVVVRCDTKFNARKLFKNRKVERIIALIQEKKHSTIFCMDDLDVPVMSTNFSEGAGCGTSEQGKEDIFGQAKTKRRTILSSHQNPQSG